MKLISETKYKIYKLYLAVNHRTRSAIRPIVIKYDAIIRFLLFEKSIVLSGPFKGMNYIGESHGSQLYPKLLGVYENELSEIFTPYNLSQFRTIIDVGCAEGYYLSGIGYLLRKYGLTDPPKLIGYDTNKIALRLARKLLKINNIQNCELYSEWSHKTLVDKCLPVLLIMDVEGMEVNLLTKESVTSLAKVTILVEVHDTPGSSERLDKLIQIFSQTHDIVRYRHRPRAISDLPFHIGLVLRRSIALSLMEEGRQYGLNWLSMTPRQEYSL